MEAKLVFCTMWCPSLCILVIPFWSGGTILWGNVEYVKKELTPFYFNIHIPHLCAKDTRITFGSKSNLLKDQYFLLIRSRLRVPWVFLSWHIFQKRILELISLDIFRKKNISFWFFSFLLFEGTRNKVLVNKILDN